MCVDPASPNHISSRFTDKEIDDTWHNKITVSIIDQLFVIATSCEMENHRKNFEEKISAERSQPRRMPKRRLYCDVPDAIVSAEIQDSGSGTPDGSSRFEVKKNIWNHRTKITTYLVITLAKHYIDHSFCASRLSRSFARFARRQPLLYYRRLYI